jgi:peptidoglycan/xylan/chitin deacetylase (PgdA/CDA1 family)
VNRKEFETDLANNYSAMAKHGIQKSNSLYFLPPYEWYNDKISDWTRGIGLELINFTPGTRSTSDYTWPSLKNYQSSETIYNSILEKERSTAAGLNGFILLVHIGANPERTDKFYHRLPVLLSFLQSKGYKFEVVDQLLKLR